METNNGKQLEKELGFEEFKKLFMELNNDLDQECKKEPRDQDEMTYLFSELVDLCVEAYETEDKAERKDKPDEADKTSEVMDFIKSKIPKEFVQFYCALTNRFFRKASLGLKEIREGTEGSMEDFRNVFKAFANREKQLQNKVTECFEKGNYDSVDQRAVFRARRERVAKRMVRMVAGLKDEDREKALTVTAECFCEVYREEEAKQDKYTSANPKNLQPIGITMSLGFRTQVKMVLEGKVK